MAEDVDALAQKLHPSRFTEMSPKMTAIVGYILGKAWTEPVIAEMAISSDGGVLARTNGDIGLNDWIGSAEDLDRNVANLLTAAGLTEQERGTWNIAYALRVDDWRGIGQERR